MALGIAVRPKVAPKLVVPAVEVEAPLDVVEYRWALAHYWRQGADGALEDVARRIVCLHNQVLYVGGKDQQEKVRLLCGFNSLAGNTLNELGFPETADRYHAKAIRLAHEKEQYDLEGFAHWRRASNLVYRVNRGHYEAALHDLSQAKALQKKLPAPLNGYVTSQLSKVRAFTAQDKADIAEATAFAKEAEQAIGKHAACNSYPLRFDRVRHVLNLSMVFVSSPHDALRLPNEALHLLESGEVPLFDETRFAQSRQLYCNLIQARVSLDKKEYAYAARLLIDALAIMEELHSVIHLSEVEALYHRLKETSYTNSVEVARLSLALTQVKYPELFW
jgi:hypothetical protein